jgi:hypothetical protein
MELVHGETLEARVRRDVPLPLRLALEVVEQTARGLAAGEMVLVASALCLIWGSRERFAHALPVRHGAAYHRDDVVRQNSLSQDHWPNGVT